MGVCLVPLSGINPLLRGLPANGGIIGRRFLTPFSQEVERSVIAQGSLNKRSTAEEKVASSRSPSHR
jgi:hypothetical protein